MADTTKTLTYEDIKKAVFYAQQKPELLTDIIAEIAGVSKEVAQAKVQQNNQ